MLLMARKAVLRNALEPVMLITVWAALADPTKSARARAPATSVLYGFIVVFRVWVFVMVMLTS